MVKDERNYLEIIALAQLTIQVDLSDVGLKTNDIAKLLGKTERAVQMQIASDSKTKKNKTLEKVKGESTK